MINPNTLIETVKQAAKIANELKNTELRSKLVDIQSEANEYQQEIIKLNQENRQLQEELAFKKKLVFRDKAYWAIEEGGSESGPYCSRCWDDEKKAIHMLVHSNNEAFASCPNCNNKSVKIFPEKDRSSGVVSAYRKRQTLTGDLWDKQF